MSDCEFCGKRSDGLNEYRDPSFQDGDELVWWLCDGCLEETKQGFRPNGTTLEFLCWMEFYRRSEVSASRYACGESDPELPRLTAKWERAEGRMRRRAKKEGVRLAR